MKYLCYDIEWDTDGEDVDLPTSLEVAIDDTDDVQDALSDALSNETGYSHKGFNFSPCN